MEAASTGTHTLIAVIVLTLDPSDSASDFSPGSVPDDSRDFRARYCDANGLCESEFELVLFRRCTPLLVRALALISRDFADRVFAPDRKLLRAVARAHGTDDVCQAINDFWRDEVNYSWWRHKAGLRMSTIRLRRIAAEYLPFRLPPNEADWAAMRSD
jgi:hypothetical protein